MSFEKKALFSTLFLGVALFAATPLWSQSGGFAYVANCGSLGCGGGVGPGNVSAYTIDGTTGALTPVAGSPFPTGLGPQGVTVDPSGRFLYVANLASSNVSAYTIDPATGALTEVAGSPFAAGTAPRTVAIDPAGQFAYVANVNSNNVSAYTIDATSGALTAVPGRRSQVRPSGRGRLRARWWSTRQADSLMWPTAGVLPAKEPILAVSQLTLSTR